jgi:enoyl-CoA hydratase
LDGAVTRGSSTGAATGAVDATPALGRRRGHVRVRRRGRVGLLTLDRPEVINALDLEMITTLTTALRRWRADPRIEVVILDGNGPRGFCAGGDLRVIHEDLRHRRGAAEELWRAEYRLDAQVASYPKPVVTVLDGITMGGGIGIGCHTRHRIVTERSALAMPEVAIGLAPDVGGLLLLARAPGGLGAHLALTAGRMGPVDAVLAGFADAVIPSDRLDRLVPGLQNADPDAVLAALRVEPSALGHGESAAQRTWIDACYVASEAGTADAASAVAAVLHRLRAHPDPAAARAAAVVERMPPLALAVTWRALAEARRLDALGPVLAQDLRVSTRFLDTPDLAEGIRAMVIDRSRTPVWSPARLADVTPGMVDRHFAGLGAGELDLSDIGSAGSS